MFAVENIRETNISRIKKIIREQENEYYSNYITDNECIVFVTMRTPISFVLISTTYVITHC